MVFQGQIFPLPCDVFVKVYLESHSTWEDCFIEPVSLADGEPQPTVLQMGINDFWCFRVGVPGSAWRSTALFLCVTCSGNLRGSFDTLQMLNR